MAYALGCSALGSDVVGVDIVDQPDYPGDFVRGDALRPPFRLDEFALVWASPPCQAYSVATAFRDTEYPDLVAPTRALLAQHRCTAMENVPGAPLNANLFIGGR